MRSPRNFGRFSVGQAVLACPLSCFCRETHFGWQGTLADGVPSGPGSENAATIPRDLLPSRDRQGAVLLCRMAVSRQKVVRLAARIGSSEGEHRLPHLRSSLQIPRHQEF